MSTIYSGEGKFEKDGEATYHVNLPDSNPNERYEFTLDNIQNFSCDSHPNRILIFMKIVGGDNNDLSSKPAGKGMDLKFHLDDIKNPLKYNDINRSEDIKVLIMHDSCTDVDHARENIHCMSDYFINNYKPSGPSDCNPKLVGPEAEPKRVRLGTLRAPK